MKRIEADDYLRLIRGQTRGPLASLGRLGLGLAAIPYRLAVGVRNLAYDTDWKQVHRAKVPVISVGNLTLGGTGKTPMVEWIARWYRQRGVRVALISRGYGHAGGVNDEGLVLEENLPDVPHLQDPDRVKLASIAVEELDSELIILDDGFQHRRLGRDLDLVMIDALDPFGLNRLFPRGLLREPVGSLKRAGGSALSRADLIDQASRDSIRATVRASGCTAPLIESRHAPLELTVTDAGSVSLEELGGQKVAAFCGIGNPEGFRRTLESLRVQVADFRVFPDHHQYTSEDVASLTAWAQTSGANLALTTQKDSVKLRTAALGAIPLRALRIGLEITDGLAAFEDALRSLVPPSRRETAACENFDHLVPPSMD